MIHTLTDDLKIGGYYMTYFDSESNKGKSFTVYECTDINNDFAITFRFTRLYESNTSPWRNPTVEGCGYTIMNANSHHYELTEPEVLEWLTILVL